HSGSSRGDWPQRCVDALAKLSRREDADAESIRILLLSDLREVFTRDRMFSKDLIEALTQMTERPWPEVCRGKPITERWLARNLAAFGIHSTTLRIDHERAKGYELEDFSNVFERYLRSDHQTESIRASVTNEGNAQFSIRDKN